MYKVQVTVNRAKGFTLQLGECLTSYDVTSLFTSVPVEPALNIIKDLLEKDEKLNGRIVLSVQDIIKLLGFCLHNTYFSFQSKFYEQVEGAAMGSPVSPIVPTCIWNILRENPQGLLLTHPGYGMGLWMTHGSSNNKPINRHF